MAFNVTATHPQYDSNIAEWRLMRAAFAGEAAIKAAGRAYLPSKTGIEAISDHLAREAAYERYLMRAEFPDLVPLVVRGAVGVMLDKPAVIELPAALEHLRESATPDGLPLDALHRRIASEIMLTGRYAILPSVSEDGTPYLAGYVAESAINWDATGRDVTYAVLDESGYVRDPRTNEWKTRARYRELYLDDSGVYSARVWVETASGQLEPGEVLQARDKRRQPLTFVPIIFGGANDTTPEPDDIPLKGLARLALRIYRMDADLTTSLHMTSEPTPMVSGYDDPAEAIRSGQIPKGVGASVLWVLPPGGDGKFLEFTGAGVQKQVEVIQKNYDRAIMHGAQLLTEQGSGSSQESGEARKLRLDNQSSTLKMIALNSAQALEKALRNLAQWVGADPDEVVVTPNLKFFTQAMSGQDVAAIVSGWLDGAYSWETAFERLKKGEVIPEDRTPEEERARMHADSNFVLADGISGI